MKVRAITCRDHKGTFKVPVKRGRVPVRCKVDNPCTMAGGQTSKEDRPELPKNRRDLRTRTLKPGAVTVRRLGKPELIASQIKNARGSARSSVNAERKLAEKAGVVESIAHDDAVAASEAAYRDRFNKRYNEKYGTLGPSYAPGDAVAAVIKKKYAPLDDSNRSVALAKKAKEELIARDWEVTGHADDEVETATITAVRGDELITIMWAMGEKVSQEYSIWDNGNMKNNVPDPKKPPNASLKFDPDELSDVELLREIAGMKVFWVNRISGSDESAVIDPGQVQIQHTYIGGRADENPGDRIIKFVDKGRGYRAFYVKQLSKVVSP